MRGTNEVSLKLFTNYVTTDCNMFHMLMKNWASSNMQGNIVVAMKSDGQLDRYLQVLKNIGNP